MTGIVKSIKRFVVNRPWLYQELRNVMYFHRRMRFKLRNVHRTATFLGSVSRISRDVKIGPYSGFGANCMVCPKVTLRGPYTMIADEVAILSGDHRIDIPGVPVLFSGRPPLKETIIESDVWIGYRAIIFAGVTIGRGAVVAAGAVVTKDIEPMTVVAGVPARVVRRRFKNEEEERIHEEFFKLPPQLGKYVEPE